MSWSLAPGSIVEVTFPGNLYGQTVLSVFHFKYDVDFGSPDGAAQLAELVNSLKDVGQLYPLWLACMTEDLITKNIVAQAVHPIRFRRYEFPPTALFGLVPFASPSANMAAAITKRGDFADKHNVGTLHMPGVPSTFQEAGSISGPGMAAYGALATKLPDTYVDGTWVPVLYNRADLANCPTITEGSVRDTTRTQRRRTKGIGI